MLLLDEITLTNIVAGLVIIGVGILLGHILGKLGRKILDAFEIESMLRKKNIKFPINDLFSSTIKFLIWIIAIVWGVFQMNIELILLLVVCILIILIFLWKLATGLREVFPNYLASKKLNIKRSVSLNDIKGKILSKGKVETKIKTNGGEILYIPNKILVK